MVPGNFGHVIHTYVPLSPSSQFDTDLRMVIPCSWEDNHWPDER